MEPARSTPGSPPAAADRTALRERLFERIEEAITPYEFDTFVLGFPREASYERAAHEKRYRQLKVDLGEELLLRRPALAVDFDRPELRIDVDAAGDVHVKPAPLFLGGRYRKLSREVQASRWTHHRCRGRGCPSCAHTGALNSPSIEELLVASALPRAGGEDASFHALGREDTDVLTLERGRPFVLEINRPRRRTLPLGAIQAEVAVSGLAEVLALRRVSLDDARLVKAVEPEKSYRAWIRASASLPPDAGARAASLAGVTLEQLSPQRVMHRRGRRALRRKHVVASCWLGEVAGQPVWEVRVQSGTYIKELVSGDGGRTRPSLSSVLEVPCVCDRLDVIAIHWDPPWES